MRHCVDGCLESALGAALRRVRSVSQHTTPHRIPLGLQLLSRQLITAEQLRLPALQETQRTNGYGRIGEWLQDLGFAQPRAGHSCAGTSVVLSRSPREFTASTFHISVAGSADYSRAIYDAPDRLCRILGDHLCCLLGRC